MTEELTFKTTQIGIFNPGRLTDGEIERAFVTRIKIFEYLLEGIVTENPDAIPQHYLIIGQRGMGKSTLLHRIAVELRKDDYRKIFIPLTFPEEQYNVDRLSKFWLNCLDALADALDREGSINQLDELDRDIRMWASRAKDLAAMKLYGHFADWAKRVDRRPVLLVDNLGLVFDRLSKEEQHQLRAILMANGAPILVGASSSTLEDTVEYAAPFYDAFQIQYLKKLTFEETQDVLRNLAEITNNPAFVNEMAAQRGRLRTLYQLTGGTPRTIVMLYPLIQNGFSVEVQNDLESLMDVMTPLYKARFEELSEQMQVILDAVALHWDPIALDDLRQITQLENSQLSSQLKRLTEVGWIERLDAYQKKGNAHQISERFFNIWYLMRRSSRRQKKELLCLTKFLVSLYGEELNQMGERALQNKLFHRDQLSVQLAIADGVQDIELAKKLRDKSYVELLEMSKNDPSILKDFYIPDDVIHNKEKEFYGILKEKTSKNNWIETSWTEVYEACEKILALKPNMAMAQSLIGHIYEKHYHDFENAELSYEAAIKMDEKFPLAWDWLGELYKNSGRYEEARVAYMKSIEINDTYAPPWIGLGELYYTIGMYKESEQSYLKAIELSSNSPYIWNGLGTLYQAIRKNEEAEKAYLKAIEIDDTFFPSLMNLLVLYRDGMNRIDEAKNIFHWVQEWNDKGDLYWLNLSIFSLYDKNFGIAEENLLQALEFNLNRFPDFSHSYLWSYTSVSLRLGYGEWLLNVLKEKGYDMKLRPYYVAIQSLLAKDSEAFLNSVAVEVREVAADLANRIKQII